MQVTLRAIQAWSSNGFLAITLPEAYNVRLQSAQILIFPLEEQDQVCALFAQGTLGVSHFIPFPGASMAFKVRRVTATQENVYVTLLWVDLALLFPGFYK